MYSFCTGLGVVFIIKGTEEDTHGWRQRLGDLSTNEETPRTANHHQGLERVLEWIPLRGPELRDNKLLKPLLCVLGRAALGGKHR